MKHYISSFTLVALCSFLAGCDMEEGGTGQSHFPYRLINRSRHIVALVNRPACMELPDSLVLRPGGGFDFEAGEIGGDMSVCYFFQNYGYDARLIYYDGRHVIRIRDLPIRRQPTYHRNFENMEDRPTYAFTDEDYAYAVEHGTDLRAE